MDSPQSVVSPFKSSSVFAEQEKQTADLFVKSPGFLSSKIGAHRKETEVYDLEANVGVLDVYIHQARDIHNICIYHKQDVYAKLCLTSDPENTVSTKIINGGGKNPIFNEKLRLGVRTVDTSLKCEIWMLSRVRNYLEDQLLGFALVPMSDVIVKDGKLEKEFSLSSTDLFHSPAGFVQLSLSYSGTLPEVLAIPSAPASVIRDEDILDSDTKESAVPNELEKIEFPDPKILNENNLMVSEYFGIPCTSLDTQSSDSFASSDTENQHSSEAGVQFVESLSTGNNLSSQFPKVDSPPSSNSAYGSPAASTPVSSQSSETPAASKSANGEYASPPKDSLQENSASTGDAESKASGTLNGGNAFVKPLVSVNIEQPDQKMVQQDIVDMYMKSMQQFTESLAKMKLPMDFESGPTSSGNSSSSDKKLDASKNSGSRVFYGSRAFF
ncbi:OLC1v1022580C1 [Oldenlandia corymbosa var. corymbosa]|uniref:OLC1v1022580C1 n=1 Tax=Oldenlandia corymbosa var. corymbosa TaxID=529605 RepID=A0AAV1BY55_OLDCO|nr:OLC1v1022580C1 [Oldenlandia corymbosa var. corymbosa]